MKTLDPGSATVRIVSLLAACLALASGFSTPRKETPFERALARAEDALASGELDAARTSIQRALETDSNSVRVWSLEARRAEAADERDELVYALHRQLSLGVGQGVLDASAANALRARITNVDPIANDLFGLKTKYVGQFRPIADRYEKSRWPHAAIAIHRRILALDPDNAESAAAIERLAAAPDPSLAADAKPVDLLDGVSKQWIAEHDAQHATWDTRARLERENYTTTTDAGYEVLVRAAEAMEQMNAFYRQFFDYGVGRSGKTVPRVELRIFRDQAGYLEHGTGPPREWSGGQYTGAAVETFVGRAGFASMTGTLFHEAAHQFVGLATNSAGWLNEGLASFFEGCVILNNGTVLMNRPADHRLFPLVARMQNGWMGSSSDGITGDPNDIPSKAPTFRTVIENEYEWGPAWYAPTWGVVYFLYNFQDHADGRFVYRAAFRDFIGRSGGLKGATAVNLFNRSVLANPAPPTKGTKSFANLPAAIDDVDEVWKAWLVRLRDKQSGKTEGVYPYARWARFAIERGDLGDATEFFERGVESDPDDLELLSDFGEFLAGPGKNPDRALKLFRRAVARFDPETEAAELRNAKEQLDRIDPEIKKLERVQAALVADATELPKRYLAEKLELMAMDVSWRLGSELGIDSMFDTYELAIRAKGRSLVPWQRAYNETDLDGWSSATPSIFEPVGDVIDATFGEYEGGDFAYRSLSLEEVTSGDFSLEADVQMERGRVAFGGLVFGQKSATDFHALILFPPGKDKAGYADLATFYGDGATKTWRHEPVWEKDRIGEDGDRSWHRLRVDVVDGDVDVWLNDSPVASQSFASADVVRGRFGLLVGRGQSRFRRVRYLSRRPRDPASRLERELRTDVPSDAESNNGSWIDAVAPFPRVSSWVSGEARTSWGEARGFPQVLVLWSIGQNDVVKIDRWLMDLNERYSALGLRVVCIAENQDAGRLSAYLAEHPFPGSVGVDEQAEGSGLGPTFRTYDVSRFFLPRLLLIDVDGKVVWEGDPGFSSNREWSGARGLLEDPLDELIKRRKLKELAEWRETWSDARAALSAGDYAKAAPSLTAAADFDADVYEDVADAVATTRAVDAALENFSEVREDFEASGREPALLLIAQWGAERGATLREVKAIEKDAHVKAWQRALGFLRPAVEKAANGETASLSDRVLERIDELEGAFCDELFAQLDAARDDPERLTAVCAAASAMPARWLADEYFDW